MSKEYWKPGNMLYPVPAVMVSCAREVLLHKLYFNVIIKNYQLIG